MSHSMLLKAAATVLVPMQMLFSIFFLWRGHNDPGGGFAAGLMVAAGLGLIAIGYSVADARRLLRVEPIRLGGVGLLVAFASAAIGPLTGNEFLTGSWIDLNLGITSLALGSPLLFDVGVYLVVIGISTSILFGLMDTEGDDEWKP